MRQVFFYLSMVLGLGAVGFACGGGDDLAINGSSGMPSGSSGSSTSGGGGSGTGTGGSSTGTGGSASSSGSSSSGSGTGGSGSACNPEGPFDGQAVNAPDNTWTWVPVAGSKCRDGSETGFGVRINPNSDKLMIFMQGGGACFNAISCTSNPNSFDSGDFDNWKNNGGKSGVFDSANASNPVQDWSAIYIPYCTGDVHAGSKEGVDVPGNFGAPTNQSFVGFVNVGLYLKQIIPTFPNVKEVLLTGTSAGGFGAAFNYDRIAQAFCPKPVSLVDDSGPVMSDTYMAPCLQTRWRDLWGLDKTMPSDCPDCIGADGGGTVHYVTHIGKKYPGARLGLISSDQDNTIRYFLGFGQNNCQGIDGFGSSLPGNEFQAGLTELRDTYLKPWASWGTYFVASTSHTYIGGNDSFYNTTVQNVALTDWFADFVNGNAPQHVGP